MVPVAAFPPAMPLTLQLTLVSVVFFTVAVNAVIFPNKITPPGALTVTLIGGGGGGGGGPTRPAPPPTQPRVQTPVARRTKSGMILAAERKGSRPNSFLCPSCGRGRMPLAMQAKGQRKLPRLFRNGRNSQKFANSCIYSVLCAEGLLTSLDDVIPQHEFAAGCVLPIARFGTHASSCCSLLEAPLSSFLDVREHLLCD